MTEPIDILEIFAKRPSEIKPGLERAKRAWEILDRPSSLIPTILVAGTNGKGSTSGILWHLLAGAGFRAGLFSSPHLIDFRERISLSHLDVTNEMLIAHIRAIKQALPSDLWKELTFFEINTILALCVFKEAKVDFIILEVGLGGRLDSTNIVQPCLSLITSIGLDHVEYLGTDTESIAMEKAWIMRPGTTCLWGGRESGDVVSDRKIRECARQLDAPLQISGLDFGGDSRTVFVDHFIEFSYPTEVSLWPKFLKKNFAMAFAGFFELLKQQDRNQPSHHSMFRSRAEGALLRFGAKNLRWPVTLVGRFHRIYIEKMGVQRVLLLDVCHNPHGAKALSAALEEAGVATEASPRPAIVSILADKDAGGIWEALKGRISDLMLFQISSERTWTKDSAELPGEMFLSFRGALQEALLRPSWNNAGAQPWLIFGSVAAIGEVLETLISDQWIVSPFLLRE
ncbi:MAG: Mur ligase family protein [Proteobacteria bacterium]|nr:Mur ligase family protein [Pseudomonadota bacterium]